MTGYATSTPAEAALFNPAFMAVLVASSASDHQRVGASDLPFPLAFLVAPLALHEGTRAALPGNITGRMSTWVLEHPLIASEFPLRARSMVPYVREGLRYGLRAGDLTLVGGHLASPRRLQDDAASTTDDVRACIRAAAFAGRWFARTGDARTIFGLLGVRP